MRGPGMRGAFAGTVLSAAFCVGWSATAAAQPTPTHTMEYARLDGRPLHLDLYLPAEGTAPYPLVIWVHGGSWSSGTKWPIPPACEGLLAEGFAVASINYRLTSQAGTWGSHDVIFPAALHDTKGAIRFLRSRAATYNLDPERFGLFGGSAGGHLSALAATSAGDPDLEGTVGGNLDQSSAVQAVADYYGPTVILRLMDDVTTPPGWTENHDAHNSNASTFIGYNQPGQGIGDIKANIDNPDPPYPQLLALLDQTNPITYVDPTDPPFFIAHGTMDALIPLNQSTRLADALAAAGVPHQYLMVEGAGHNASQVGAVADAQVIEFFKDVFFPCVTVIEEAPADVIAPATGSAVFTVLASGPDLTYQWRKDDVPLADDERTLGATTEVLTLSALTPADAGRYDVVVSGPCGEVTVGATLTVTACVPDWDGNGVLGVEDFTAFRNAFLAGDMAADVNADGALGVADFLAFRNAYIAGCL